MVAVLLSPFTLAGPVANSGSVTAAYPTGFTQADFIDANASATGAVAINSNDIYEQAAGKVGLGYGASVITVTNTSGQTWPTGAKVQVQAAKAGATVGGGGGQEITAAALVSLVAAAAADETLGPQLGAQVDLALASREEEDQLAALVARGALVLAAGEAPAEDDLLAFDDTGAVKASTTTPLDPLTPIELAAGADTTGKLITGKVQRQWSKRTTMEDVGSPIILDWSGAVDGNGDFTGHSLDVGIGVEGTRDICVAGIATGLEDEQFLLRLTNELGGAIVISFISHAGTGADAEFASDFVNPGIGTGIGAKLDVKGRIVTSGADNGLVRFISCEVPSA